VTGTETRRPVEAEASGEVPRASSTLANAVAARLAIPVIQIDSHYWQVRDGGRVKSTPEQWAACHRESRGLETPRMSCRQPSRVLTRLASESHGKRQMCRLKRGAPPAERERLTTPKRG
jgi:hypothetical protein